MNKLPMSKRTHILAMRVEGMSMREITRLTGASINTVAKLLNDAGHACAPTTMSMCGGFAVTVASSATRFERSCTPRNGRCATRRPPRTELAFVDDLRGRLEDRP